MEIQGQSAIVAGGGSGMGEAVCRFLAEKGAQVVVLDISENAAVQVATAIEGTAIACDVTQGHALEEAFKQIESSLNTPLSIAVNCAGIAPAQKMVGKNGPMPLSDFEKVISINLVGTFNVMRLSAALMMKHNPDAQEECGVIVNTASVAAFEGQIGQTAYSASKGGVVGMTLAAARELAQSGIRVMTVAPGFIDTPMLKDLPINVRTSLQAQTLFPKRFGLPTEFAQLVGQIIENPMLNGEVIRFDGGVRMRRS